MLLLIGSKYIFAQNITIINGNITPVNATIYLGESIRYSYSPNDASYKLDSIILNGQSLGTDSVSNFTVRDINPNTSFSVVYTKKSFAINQKTTIRRPNLPDSIIVNSIGASQPNNINPNAKKQINLPISFNDSTVDYTLTDFGAVITTDTIISSIRYKKTVKPNGSSPLSGIIIGNLLNATNGAILTPFSKSDAPRISLRIYSTTPNTRVRLKILNALDSTKSVETDASTISTNRWDTLKFDFSKNITGTNAWNNTFTYNKIIIYFDYNNSGIGKSFLWGQINNLTYTFDSAVNWQESFDYTGLPDSTKWGYDIGGSGWGNGELQYYTATNANVSNGNLIIRTAKETVGGSNYTSSRLVTKNKADFLYGRFIVRAKLPQGRGTWPAVWMLPTDNFYGGWPHSGELDIIEAVGFTPNKVWYTTHSLLTGGQGIGGSKEFTDIYNTYHTYQMDWTPYSIKYYTDDVFIFEFLNDGKGYQSWPFNKKYHLIVNNAVGGNWGGKQGVDTNIFPTTMTVDYIKVFNCTNCETN